MSKNGPLVPELQRRGAEHVDLDLLFRSPWSYLHKVRRLAQYLREHPMDIVTPQSVRATLITALARNALRNGERIPLITTVHNIHSKVNYLTAGGILNRASDFVIFESQYERGRLVARGLRHEKTTVIHSGIDLDRFRPQPKNPDLLREYGLSPESLIIGTIARFSEEKGYPYLLEAFSIVARHMPNAVLLMVGDGPLQPEIRNRAVALGLQHRVIFAGLQRDVPAYLSLFDLFALASTRESFPLSAREAMASGKPVVATRVGGCHEVVEHGQSGLLVSPADPPALADAFRMILTDLPLREKMGCVGRIRAEEKFGEKTWIESNEAIFLDFSARFAGGCT
jgi:glycosyltransferase involved in cell wall biosynthesis